MASFFQSPGFVSSFHLSSEIFLSDHLCGGGGREVMQSGSSRPKRMNVWLKLPVSGSQKFKKFTPMSALIKVPSLWQQHSQDGCVSYTCIKSG